MRKNYRDLSRVEVEEIVRRIVPQCASECEIRERLRAALRYPLGWGINLETREAPAKLEPNVLLNKDGKVVWVELFATNSSEGVIRIGYVPR